MKRLLTIIFLISISSSLFAIDSSKCSKLLNAGLWKTYKYQGIGEYGINAITKGTKQDGCSKASSEGMTTEPTTAILDPKYWSNTSTSVFQSYSSWGECSLFAEINNLKKQRTQYIAQNFDEINIELARGKGEHIKVITYYSACDQVAYPILAKELQSRFETFININNKSIGSKKISNTIDNIIKTNKDFKSSCYII